MTVPRKQVSSRGKVPDFQGDRHEEDLIIHRTQNEKREGNTFCIYLHSLCDERK